MEKKGRISIRLPTELIDDLDKMAFAISNQRQRVCTKSELCEIALVAFLVGYENEKKNKAEEKEN